MYQVTLTDKQIVALEVYIRRMADFRKWELEFFEKLGEQRNEDGSLKHSNTADIIKWRIDIEEELHGVLSAVEAAKWEWEGTK